MKNADLRVTAVRVVGALGVTLLGVMPIASSGASANVSVVTSLSAYGISPLSPLLSDSQGNLYGALAFGTTGTSSNGTVFSVAPGGSTSVLHAFSSSDGSPDGSIVRTSDGSIYGVTSSGGTNHTGSVYKIASDGSYTVLHSFAPWTTINRDGFYPQTLIQGSDGALYGATKGGGRGGLGTVFRITTRGRFSVLYAFRLSNHGYAIGPCTLISGDDGLLYGATITSTGSGGTLFKLDLDGNLTMLHYFGFTQQGSSCPYIAQGKDGDFYGTTPGYDYKTASSGSGTVYKMAPDGTLRILYTFSTTSADHTNTDGAAPLGVIQTADGNLYGITQVGGQHGAGVLFSIATDGSLTNLYNFPTTLNGELFGFPKAGIIQGADGAFYGTTASGDDSNPAVFKAVIEP